MSTITTIYADENEKRTLEAGGEFTRCNLCNPETSEEAMFGVESSEFPYLVGRHVLADMAEKEFLSPAFPISEVERLKVYLDPKIQELWPDSPIITFDLMDLSAYVIDPSDKDPDTAVVRVIPTPCCGLFQIGDGFWRWEKIWLGHDDLDPA